MNTEVKPVWTRVKEFKREINRGKYYEQITLAIATSDASPFPRYSVRTGVLKDPRDGEDGDDMVLFPFINPFVLGQATNETHVDDSLLILAGLCREAHDWVVQHAENIAADYQQWNAERGQRTERVEETPRKEVVPRDRRVPYSDYSR